MIATERLDELRDLPRVSEEDRERYEVWERKARDELAEVDSAAKDRAKWLHAQRKGWVMPFAPIVGVMEYVMSVREWRKHWRSLPNYGGGGHAPSGRVTQFPAVNSVADSIDYGLLKGWIRHLGGCMEIARRNDTREAIYSIGYVAANPYESPSLGGRGWCEKFSEVVT